MFHPQQNATVVDEQQRHRSAYASAQFDQRLCYSLSRKYLIPLDSLKNFREYSSKSLQLSRLI